MTGTESADSIDARVQAQPKSLGQRLESALARARTQGLAAVLVALIALFALRAPGFATVDNFGDVLRWTDNNDWYKAYIDGQNLVIQKKVAGTASILATLPFAAVAGTSVMSQTSVLAENPSARRVSASASAAS